jgi:hypothetical protein
VDDYEDDEIIPSDEELFESDYEPLTFSWRVFAHNTISHGAAAVRVGASWLDELAQQFAHSNAKWRAEIGKASAKDEAAKMLAALDDL